MEWNGSTDPQQSPLSKYSPANQCALANTNNLKVPEDVNNKGNLRIRHMGTVYFLIFFCKSKKY